MNLGGPSLSNPTGSASSSLIRLVKRRDPTAWQRLSTMFGPVVYGWARQSGLQSSDAADVMQEVFRSVSISIEAFERKNPGDSFRGWLWTITRNKIRDHFRNEAGRPHGMGGPDAQQLLAQIPEAPPDDSSLTGGGSTVAHIARQSLEIVRAEFEPRTWQAFWKVAVENESPADVAAALQMSVTSVYAAKCRILKRLRAELQDLE
jgi:RNA polymerase sigma-70 factor (ECF subfamily)